MYEAGMTPEEVSDTEKAQNPGLSAGAVASDDEISEGECANCGQVHGNPFTADEMNGQQPFSLGDLFAGFAVPPRRSRSDEAQLLQGVLDDVFGDMPGVKAQVFVPDAEPYLTLDQVMLINHALLLIACTYEIAANPGDPMVRFNGARVGQMLRDVFAAQGLDTPAAIVDALSAIGHKLNALTYQMHNGATRGLFVAPF